MRELKQQEDLIKNQILRFSLPQNSSSPIKIAADEVKVNHKRHLSDENVAKIFDEQLYNKVL